MKRIVLSFVLMLFVGLAFSQDSKADRLVGVWEPSDGKAKIKIEKKDGKYYGKIVWLKEPKDENGKPKVDKNNPEESLRDEPVLGLVILKDMVYEGKNVWGEGTVYDPENGNTYSGTIKMEDKNTLDLRGYIGIKAFGRSDTWKRLELKSR